MKPFIYVHELLSNSGGIWIGCTDEKCVRDSYEEGETGQEVIALVKLSDVDTRIEELEALVERAYELEYIDGDWVDQYRKIMGDNK